MMSIKLICVGKNREGSIQKLIDNYQKMIRSFAKVDQVFVPDISLTKTNNPQMVKDKESELILRSINKKPSNGKKNPYIIVLDRKGKMHDSLSFADLLNDRISTNELVFVIGGIFGVNDLLRDRADLLLSLSSLTFTHQMARIIILEQLYRALTILNNKRYHY